MTAQPKNSLKTEVVAGITTFVTMAYIVVVNPGILSQAKMPFSEVFFATCVSSAVATLLMGLYARYPFALAPGMGLNALIGVRYDANEIAAGVTTFLTMAYIVVVNPAILSKAGMPLSDVFFATCVASAAATITMALWAKYPFALAPGMGLNAFFAFTVCGQMGLSWRTALACVLVSGIVFLVLSIVGLREKLIKAIPQDLVRAVSGGIGLFIAFIGLEHAGIVAPHPVTFVTLGEISSPEVIVAVVGLVLTVGLAAARVPGAILVGIAVTTILSFAFGLSPLPTHIVEAPSLPKETFGAAVFALKDLGRLDVLPVMFTLLFLALFDTMGTLLALGYASGHADKQGNFPRVGRAFTADATGTVIGALCGTSTVTTYMESAAGIAVGGRDGRSALVTAALFLLVLPLFPLAAAIPASATAPALIVVGAMMMQGMAEIDWKDPVVAIPALCTALLMPATFSISNGLGAGFILYVVANLGARRFKAINPAVIVIASAFVLYFIVGAA